MARLRPLLGLAAALALALPAGAELYRWTDAEGRVHYAQELRRVPPEHRAEAEPARGSVQRYAAPEGAALPERTRAGGPHRVPFERHGNVMLVEVRLNGRVTAPFYVDTGASDVAIPAALVERLGIAIGPRTPRRVYETAGGRVSKPVVTLDAVELGGARVEGVRASVSRSMEVGLLGGTFFNHFEMAIDPAEQVLTLRRSDGVRGGYTEAQWRSAFDRLRSDLERLERHLDSGREIRGPRRDELEARRDELREALERLEIEARRAGVPQRWRE